MRLGAIYGNLEKGLDFPLSESHVWWAILDEKQSSTLRNGLWSGVTKKGGHRCPPLGNAISRLLLFRLLPGTLRPQAGDRGFAVVDSGGIAVVEGGLPIPDVSDAQAICGVDYNNISNLSP